MRCEKYWLQCERCGEGIETNEPVVQLPSGWGLLTVKTPLARADVGRDKPADICWRCVTAFNDWWNKPEVLGNVDGDKRNQL